MDRKFTEWHRIFDGKGVYFTVKVKAHDVAPSPHTFYIQHGIPHIEVASESLVTLGQMLDAALAQATQIDWTPILYVEADMFDLRTAEGAIGSHRETHQPYYRRGWIESAGEPDLGDYILIPDTPDNRALVERIKDEYRAQKARHDDEREELQARSHNALSTVKGARYGSKTTKTPV